MCYPLVVSYHTGAEPYVSRAKRLAASCERLEIDCEIYKLNDAGTWIQNVAMKGPFLHEVMKRQQCPIMWIDADGYLIERPEQLKGLEADFAIHTTQRNRRTWRPIGRGDQHLPEAWPGTSWFMTGTMFFNNTERGRLLLEKWSAESARRQRDYQQLLLQEVWTSMAPQPETLWLPDSYCSIRGRTRHTVVYHDLASTEIKNVVRA